jgi:hypothetical protein
MFPALVFLLNLLGAQAISEGNICIGIVTVHDESERLRFKHSSANSKGNECVVPTAPRSAMVVFGMLSFGSEKKFLLEFIAIHYIPEVFENRS